MINDDTVYIGLDYGTTRSAVAFRYGNDEIGFWSSWPDMPQDSPSRIKGPTISAYSIGKEGTVPVLAAVGHKAVKLLAEDTNNQLIEIRKPKMDGIPVLTIVSDYLAELKKGVLQMRAQALPGKNQPTKFRWCLTVPAIWTDDEKRVMRNAATKAGLIEDPEDLLLVLEPEGAVVSFVEYAAKNNIVTENKIVLVVDAGGGTMDLTVHKMSSERLEEVCPGIGNHFGSDTINDKIIEKLKNHFGKNQLFEWKSTKKKLYLKMLLQIENAKCSIKDYKVNSEIDLPNSLGKISIKPTHETGLKIIVDDDDAFKLIITGDAWRDCFKDAIEVTTKMVNELIDKVQKKGTEVNYVWLVGGFSNSRILQNAIIDKCKGRLANSDYVVIPPIPEVSIVAGAIYFGKNPAYIGKRVQRNTIGLEVMEDWDDVKHLGREPWINKLTGKKFCPHVFHCLAKRDQTFEYNSTSEIVTSILYENQRVTNLLFYETVKEDTKYVTDDQQMKLVGQLIVSIPNTNNNADRKVKIEVFYGRGERKAIAYNLSNPNEIYKATLEGANQKARLKYHTIFVIDNSGSMSEKDLSPPPASKFLKNNNRLGAVFEACNAFIGSRIQAASQAPAEFKKNLQNRLSKIIPNASAYNDVNDDVDIYSMIKFNSTAEIVFEKKPLSEQLVDYLTFTPQGGTCYGKALTLVKSLLQPSQSLDSSKRHVPVIIFLSDGEDSGDQKEVMELIENMLVYFPLNMNTVHIGSSNDGKERLAKMAQLGNGCFTPAGSSLDNLLVTFELIAAKL